jgi:two-component system sensor histidine kinase QseC
MRRVLMALVFGTVLAWAAIVCVNYLQLRYQLTSIEKDPGGSLLGFVLVQAVQGIEDPAQAVTAIGTFDRILAAQRRRNHTPMEQVFQLSDRAGTMLYSSASIEGEVLHGGVRASAGQMLHGRRYLVAQVVTPRWTVSWGHTTLGAGQVAAAAIVDRDVLTRVSLAIPCLLLPLWLAVSQGLKPLRRFSEGLARRGPEDLSCLGFVPVEAEMTPIARALDDLLSRLRRKIAAERDFVASAAHELRTPLAVMSAEAHALAGVSATERAAASSRLDAAAARASHLIHQLLVLARLDQERAGQRAVVDLAALARQEMALFVSPAYERHIDLSLEAPDSLSVLTDAHCFRSILSNLVDNAVRYGRDSGRVMVTLSPVGDEVALVVADDGPGIAEAERDRIFDKFFRGESARNTQGTGLGLAIAHRAATTLGAVLTLSAGLDGLGCRFSLTIQSQDERHNAAGAPARPAPQSVARRSAKE